MHTHEEVEEHPFDKEESREHAKRVMKGLAIIFVAACLLIRLVIYLAYK